MIDWIISFFLLFYVHRNGTNYGAFTSNSRWYPFELDLPMWQPKFVANFILSLFFGEQNVGTILN